MTYSLQSHFLFPEIRIFNFASAAIVLSSNFQYLQEAFYFLSFATDCHYIKAHLSIIAPALKNLCRSWSCRQQNPWEKLVVIILLLPERGQHTCPCSEDSSKLLNPYHSKCVKSPATSLKPWFISSEAAVLCKNNVTYFFHLLILYTII